MNRLEVMTAIDELFTIVYALAKSDKRNDELTLAGMEVQYAGIKGYLEENLK